MAALVSTAADVLVIFGITRDLATKKTFRSLYRLDHRRMLHTPVIGVARPRFPSQRLSRATWRNSFTAERTV